MIAARTKAALAAAKASSVARRLAARAHARQVHHQRPADDRGGVDQGARRQVVDVTPEKDDQRCSARWPHAGFRWSGNLSTGTDSSTWTLR